MGKIADAQETLIDFLKQYPGDALAMFALARLYDLSGDRIAAMEKYRAVVRLQPDNKLSQLAEERISLLQGFNK
jgi:Tfp pilus assembly protein PilF